MRESRICREIFHNSTAGYLELATLFEKKRDCTNIGRRESVRLNCYVGPYMLTHMKGDRQGNRTLQLRAPAILLFCCICGLTRGRTTIQAPLLPVQISYKNHSPTVVSVTTTKTKPLKKFQSFLYSSWWALCALRVNSSNWLWFKLPVLAFKSFQREASRFFDAS